MLRRPVGDYQRGLAWSHVRTSLHLRIARGYLKIDFGYSTVVNWLNKLPNHDASIVFLSCSFLFSL
jgi:hypothetical protein